MDTVAEVARLRHQVAGWRREGALVGLVPTMGALHAGHLSLVHIARERADRVVASVFVNPTQFAPHEDLGRYPRSPERDAELLAGAGCDLLFLPAVDTIYPPGHATFVEPGGAARGLEGDLRPGHFRGVATVVTQLFHLVAPDVAVFGEKDAQQLAVVRQLVRDLHLPVEILAGPTVRESDGLAMSSRNAYLDAEQRRAAPVLHRALSAAEALIASGERRAAAVCERLRATLAEEPRLTIDYVAAVDADSFQPLATLAGNVVLPIAVRLGGTRLIDNLRLRVVPAGIAPSPLPAAAPLT
jgi:pantoate--beta-alanine ligase